MVRQPITCAAHASEAGLPRQFRNMIDLMQYENETDGGKQHEMRAEQPEY